MEPKSCIRRKTSLKKHWICTNDFDNICRKAAYIWRLYSPRRAEEADQNQSCVRRESVGGNAQWPLLGRTEFLQLAIGLFPPQHIISCQFPCYQQYSLSLNNCPVALPASSLFASATVVVLFAARRLQRDRLSRAVARASR